MYFCYFIIISPWEKTWPFLRTNLNLLHSKLFCAKFGCNLLSGSGEVDKNVKSLCMDGWTDNRLSENFTWSSSSGWSSKKQEKEKKKNMYNRCRNHFHLKTLNGQNIADTEKTLFNQLIKTYGINEKKLYLMINLICQEYHYYILKSTVWEWGTA